MKNPIVMRRRYSSAAASPLQREAIRLLEDGTILMRTFAAFVEQADAKALHTCLDGSVQVGASTVCKSRGLFASIDIDAFQVVGCYPIQSIGLASQRGLP